MAFAVIQVVWTRPLALAALVALPVLVVYWQRSLTHLSPVQKFVSVLLRTLFVLLMSVALAGPVVTSESREAMTVAVVDVSRSVSPQSATTIEAFASAAAQRKFYVRGVKFAGQTEAFDFAAPLEGKLSATQGFANSTPAESNLAAALVAARAMIPADRVGKIILFTDGNETTGNAVAAAAAVGVPVDTVPLPCVAPEYAVASIAAPHSARAGERYFVEVRVQATQAGEGSIELVSDGNVVALKERSLPAGECLFRFPFLEPQPTTKIYTARIRAPGDTLTENNSASCGIRVGPRARVLVVDRQTALAEHLRQALVNQYIDVEVRTPERMPTAVKEMRDYELVILSNLSADMLPAVKMQALVDYVHDEGGGLIVVGGDHAFTAGGYRGSILEAALPVISEVNKDRPKPTLAMVLVLDISGSMEGRSMELAKQALSRAVEKLGPHDQIGVLVFEDESHWIAPLGPTSNKDKILAQIQAIKAEGGTTMYPAIDRAYLALHGAFADRKHIIVMTDGVSNPGDYNALARKINADGISVSMVGVGGEPARPLLQGIADTAKGRAYFCDDVAALPKIFEMETLAAGRPGVTEERFIPKVAHAAQALREIEFDQAPLLGYVATQARPESHVILTTNNEEPLLAMWRYGRGASVAFTSDVQSTWAGVWFNWPGFGKFWSQLVRQTMRSEPAIESVLSAKFSDRTMHVALDAVDRQGHWINDADIALTATHSATGAASHSSVVAMTPIAPGRYAADLPAAAEGVYALSACVGPKENPLVRVERFVSVPYADEFRVLPTNLAKLRKIAEASGGKFDAKPEEIFAESETTTPVKTATAPYLMAGALLVFLLDLMRKRW